MFVRLNLIYDWPEMAMHCQLQVFIARECWKSGNADTMVFSEKRGDVWTSPHFRQTSRLFVHSLAVTQSMTRLHINTDPFTGAPDDKARRTVEHYRDSGVTAII